MHLSLIKGDWAFFTCSFLDCLVVYSLFQRELWVDLTHVSNLVTLSNLDPVVKVYLNGKVTPYLAKRPLNYPSNVKGSSGIFIYKDYRMFDICTREICSICNSTCSSSGFHRW